MEMAETGLTQAQAVFRTAQQPGGQGAEIGLMPHQKTAACQLGQQGPAVPAGHQTGLHLQLPSQASLHRKRRRLARATVRAGQQSISPEAQSAQATRHRQGAMKTDLGQGTLGVIVAELSLLGDAMAQQIQINRS